MPPRQKAAAASAPTRPRKVRLTKPPAASDWFAEVDGERVPLALQHWAAFEARTARYHDPMTADGKAATPTSPDYAAALRDGVVLLMRSKETRGAAGVSQKRDGPIGLYRIANVDVGDDGLRFDFVERIGVF